MANGSGSTSWGTLSTGAKTALQSGITMYCNTPGRTLVSYTVPSDGYYAVFEHIRLTAFVSVYGNNIAFSLRVNGNEVTNTKVESSYDYGYTAMAGALCFLHTGDSVTIFAAPYHAWGGSDSYDLYPGASDSGTYLSVARLA